MCCLLTVMAFIGPRAALIIWWLTNQMNAGTTPAPLYIIRSVAISVGVPDMVNPSADPAEAL
jgi:hypothetical protein